MKPTQVTTKRAAILMALMPFLLALLLASGTTRGGFVFDDLQVVKRDQRLGGLAGLPALFRQNYWGEHVERGGLYRPLVLSSFAVERALWGTESAAPYHATNTILYGLCAAFLSLLVLAAGAGHAVALLAGILFACHPIHVEPVASLVGRAELGAGLLVLVVLLNEMRGGDPWGAQAELRHRGWRRAAGSSLAMLAALFCKESALGVLPVLVLLPLIGGGPDETWHRRIATGFLHRWRSLALLVLVTLIWFGLRSAAIQGASPQPLFLNNLLAHRDAVGRVAGALAVSNLYHRMALVPWPLSADYSYAALVPTGHLFSPAALLGGLLWLGLPVCAWCLRRLAPLASLGICIYLLSLLPVTNILVTIGTIFGERLLFMPSVGVCLVLAAIAAPLLQRRDGRRSGRRGVALAAATAVAILGATGFLIRVPDWRSDEALATSMVRAQPMSVKAHSKLGWELYKEAVADPVASEADFDRAQHHLERSIELCREVDDEFIDSHVNLVIVHAARGKEQLALQVADEIMRRAPDRLKGLRVVAALNLQVGRLEEALAVSARGLRLYPGSAELRQIRNESLKRLIAGGEFTTVVNACEVALAEEPEAAGLHHLLIEAYARSGDTSRALEVVNRILSREPGATRSREPGATGIAPEARERAAFHIDRGMIWTLRNDHARALRDFSAALALAPDLSAARVNRVKSLIQLSRLVEAETELDAIASLYGDEQVAGLRQLLAEARGESWK